MSEQPRHPRAKKIIIPGDPKMREALNLYRRHPNLDSLEPIAREFERQNARQYPPTIEPETPSVSVIPAVQPDSRVNQELQERRELVRQQVVRELGFVPGNINNLLSARMLVDSSISYATEATATDSTKLSFLKEVAAYEDHRDLSQAYRPIKSNRRELMRFPIPPLEADFVTIKGIETSRALEQLGVVPNDFTELVEQGVLLESLTRYIRQTNSNNLRDLADWTEDSYEALLMQAKEAGASSSARVKLGDGAYGIATAINQEGGIPKRPGGPLQVVVEKHSTIPTNWVEISTEAETIARYKAAEAGRSNRLQSESYFPTITPYEKDTTPEGGGSFSMEFAPASVKVSELARRGNLRTEDLQDIMNKHFEMVAIVVDDTGSEAVDKFDNIYYSQATKRYFALDWDKMAATSAGSPATWRLARTAETSFNRFMQIADVMGNSGQLLDLRDKLIVLYHKAKNAKLSRDVEDTFTSDTLRKVVAEINNISLDDLMNTNLTTLATEKNLHLPTPSQ